jgi:predicted ArsR family transcriptional regulator
VNAPTLFDHVRATDPPTSVAAAASLDAATLGRQKARVLDAVRTFGGRATREQVAQLLGHDRSCISRRITDLVRDGLLEDSGDTARGGSGRAQTVWMLREVDG